MLELMNPARQKAAEILIVRGAGVSIGLAEVLQRRVAVGKTERNGAEMRFDVRTRVCRRTKSCKPLRHLLQLREQLGQADQLVLAERRGKGRCSPAGVDGIEWRLPPTRKDGLCLTLLDGELCGRGFQPA